MSDEQLSGEEIMAQNMAALDSGEDIPHDDGDFPEPLESVDEPDIEDDPEGEGEPFADDPDDPEPISEEARKAGYQTKEQWVERGNDPDDYLSEADFNKVGDLQRNKDEFSRHKLSKELVKSQRLTQEVLANQEKMLRESEERVRTETIDKLRKEQKEAVEYSDTEKALELEREISKHEKKPEPEPKKSDVSDSVQEFHDKNNDWYGVDRGSTDLLNVELGRAQRKGLDFDEAIGPAMAKVKANFSYLFDDEPAAEPAKAPRPRATSERSRARPSAKPKSRTFNDLPPEMQQFAKRSAKAAGMSEKEYMEQM